MFTNNGSRYTCCPNHKMRHLGGDRLFTLAQYNEFSLHHTKIGTFWEIAVKSLLGTCLRVVPVFMLPVWAPMPCPPTLSQTILKHTGETGTASYSAHTGLTQDQDFRKNFLNCMHLSPSWLTRPLPSKVWDCSPAHMLPLCKICIPALGAFTCIEERYHKHAPVSACVLH